MAGWALSSSSPAPTDDANARHRLARVAVGNRGRRVFVAWRPFDRSTPRRCQNEVTLLALHDGTVELHPRRVRATEALVEPARAQSAANGHRASSCCDAPAGGTDACSSVGGRAPVRAGPPRPLGRQLDATRRVGSEPSPATGHAARGVTFRRSSRSPTSSSPTWAPSRSAPARVDWALMFLSEPDVATRPLRARAARQALRRWRLRHWASSPQPGARRDDGGHRQRASRRSCLVGAGEGQMVVRAALAHRRRRRFEHLAFASRGFFSACCRPFHRRRDPGPGMRIEAWVLGLRDVAVADDDTLYCRPPHPPRTSSTPWRAPAAPTSQWSRAGGAKGGRGDQLGMFWRVLPGGREGLVGDDAPSPWRVLSSTEPPHPPRRGLRQTARRPPFQTSSPRDEWRSPPR